MQGCHHVVATALSGIAGLGVLSAGDVSGSHSAAAISQFSLHSSSIARSRPRAGCICALTTTYNHHQTHTLVAVLSSTTSCALDAVNPTTSHPTGFLSLTSCTLTLLNATSLSPTQTTRYRLPRTWGVSAEEPEYKMSGFRGVMKDGWHPKGRDGGKESWRGDFKGINQVVST